MGWWGDVGDGVGMGIERCKRREEVGRGKEEKRGGEK